MQASNYGNIRGDGVQGQIENISVGYGVHGHAYTGQVVYYSGEENAPFTVMFSGVDDSGVRHVYDSETIDTFGPGGNHPFEFVYNDPDV